MADKTYLVCIHLAMSFQTKSQCESTSKNCPSIFFIIINRFIHAYHVTCHGFELMSMDAFAMVSTICTGNKNGDIIKKRATK